MSDQEIKEGKSFICEHDRMRRKCPDCEVLELYKEVDAKDAVILAQAKEIESVKAWLKNAEAKENNYDNLRRGFDLAVKALEEIKSKTVFHTSVESLEVWEIAQSTLEQIRRGVDETNRVPPRTETGEQIPQQENGS